MVNALFKNTNKQLFTGNFGFPSKNLTHKKFIYFDQKIFKKIKLESSKIFRLDILDFLQLYTFEVTGSDLDPLCLQSS